MSDATPVDLRSDTVTRPTPEMRAAMAGAEVGDDVYGEDPTVNALEAEFAARLGKEAAVFVPSGTMANQLALRMLTRPGDVVLAGRRSHVVAHENGAGPLNAGIQFHALDDAGGHLGPEEVRWVIDAAAHHQPRPSLICVEDTYMPAAGAAIRPDELEALAACGLPLHLDGARLWNAEVATGIPVSSLAKPATTVMCCLSKGLCAPVGSLLAGPAETIAGARIERQRLGGAMRQAGVIAAAGLVALRTMVDRLADDHRRAAVIAATVAERWTLEDKVETNIVTFAADRALIEHLASSGVVAGTIAPDVVRLMTHHDVDDAGVARACAALAEYAGP